VAKLCSKALIDDDHKRELASQLAAIEGTPMCLAFVDALQKGLQNELREKDESMRIAETIVSIAKQAVLLCKKPDTNELVSMLKADDMEFRARLTENEELRSHPLLAALFKFEVHSSMPYKWEGSELNIKNRDVLRAFGSVPGPSDGNYSEELMIFCQRGGSLPNGRGFVRLYKRNGVWRIGGDLKEKCVIPELLSFIKG